MVMIQEIRYNGSTVHLILDNSAHFWLRADDLVQTDFMENKEYDEEYFYHQIRLCQYPRALNMAVSLLSKRSHSKSEMISRLRMKRFSKEVIDQVLLKLEKEKLINDEEFCKQWIRFRQAKKYGPAFIRHELKTKGIPDDLISALLLESDLSDEKNASSLAFKAWGRIRPGDDIRKSRQKIISFLVRKGYDWETARTACLEAEGEYNKTART